MTAELNKMSLLLIVSEGAWWPVEGSPPSGAYGVDWCVMRAVTGRDALKQAPAMVTGVWPVPGDADATCLSEGAAHAAFASEGAIMNCPTRIVLTPTQREWLENVARPHVGPRNWAGCPYAVLAALVRKGLVARKAYTPKGYSQWDTYEITDAGRALLRDAS